MNILTKEEALQKIEELKQYVNSIDVRPTLSQIMDKFQNTCSKLPRPATITDDMYIKVPLPAANIEWTISVFHWVEEFCKTYPNCYPEHRKHFDYDYIYINCTAHKL